MKKHISKKRVFLKILVALTVLSSMLVSTLLGVSKAEYFKSMSNKLDVELTPDLDLEYYLYDASVIDGASSTFTGEHGVYKNSNSFSQIIIPGKPDNKVTLAGQTGDVYYADRVVYQIKIPVDKTGYYTLDFNSYFSRVDSNGTSSSEFYTINAKYCVGCEIVTDTDIVAGSSYDKFGSSDNWSMPYRVYGVDDSSKKTNDIHELIYTDNVINGGNVDNSDTVYQWKTLAPSRYENVKLTFKVTTGDVNKGYVVWCWDLTGLESAGYQYTLHVDSLKVTKTMNLDGTTEHRTLNDPYFIFPQTAYSNNYFESDSNGAGSNHYANGRGSYVYEATDNSLGMRAEILYDDLDGGDSDKKQNPLSLYIPLKNIKYDKTYKVTFDFSVAKQGSNSVDNAIASKRNWYNYDDFANIFRSGTDKITTLDGDGRACWSYLYSYPQNSTDVLYRHSYSGHKDFMGQISYANKTYGQYTSGQYTYGYPLTKYDEVTDGFENGYTTSTSVNDTYSKNELTENSAQGIYKSQSRNWFNAIEHTEYNGQYKINWITFYNTTFSFNIPKADNTDVDLDNLYWVWMIDILKYTAFYNIRIDNVRIEEVVEYGSGFNLNGVKIGGVQLDQTIHSDNHDASNANGSDLKGGVRGTFAAFRGMTGTGQNFQSKRNILDAITSPTSKQFFTNSANIYSPIIDASRFTVADSTQGTPYKIELSGYAVCKGGVSKYVYSLDGGNTWHDMTFSGGNASNSELTNASNSINQYASGQSVYKSEDFTWTSTDSRPTHEECTHSTLSVFDTINGSFSDWSLSVDLSAYKHQANLDVIIAAVPETNTNLRCEILRIINFNQIRNYMTFPFDFVSDIKVKVGSNQSPLNVNRLDESSAPGEHGHYYDDRVAPEAIGFTAMRTWILNNGSGGSGPSSSTGYARIASNSYAYEDIRTLYSDMPVKTTLGLTGWAIVEGGVDAYYWSADHGKNWVPCTSMNTTTNVGTNPATPETRSLISPAYKMYYYDGIAFDASKQADVDLQTNHCFRDSIDGQFNGGDKNTVSANGSTKSGDMITANLSAYVGQCVDVIFAAKPVGSDVYVPIGRCDNVGVYGENGLFWSRVGGVKLDGTAIAATTLDTDGKTLNMTTDRWSNLVATTNTNNQTIHPEDYSFYEPQNVNCVNSRLYNNKVNVMQSGGNVTLNGYIIAEKGIKRYKYSLDGGETWTIINHVVKNIRTDGWNGKHVKELISKTLNNDFSIAQDGVGGFYYLVDSYDDGPSMTFNLPALPDGAMRNLLVVAEGNADDNNDGEGNLYPILNIKLKFKYNDNISQYGYHYTPNKADLSTIQAGWQSEFNQDWAFVPTPSSTLGISNTLNRITIPVTEAGEHQLRFTHTLDNGPSETVTQEHYLYNDTKDSPNKVNNVHRTARITLSTTKTHYLVGEKIGLTFSCKFNNDTTSKGGFGTVTAAIISDDWLNESGRQYTLYSQRFAPGPKGSTAGTISIDDITSAANNTHENSGVYSNPGMPEWALDLKAGKYSIVLIHRQPYYVNSKNEQVSYGLADILETEVLRQRYVLAEVPIYIHDRDETVEFSVVHDKGEETYFCDVSRQFTSVGEKKNPNADHIYTLTDPFRNDDVRAINATVNVTEGDVKRGYIVLDANYSNLMSINEHTKEQCETEYGTDWGVQTNTSDMHTHDQCISRDDKNGSLFTKQKLGDTLYNFTNLDDIPHGGFKYNVKMSLGPNALVRKITPAKLDMSIMTAPSGYANAVFTNTVKKEQSYELKLDPILNPQIKKGNFNFDGGEKFAGSYLSVPKTYFNVGEPITVDYKVVGATTGKVYIYITSDQMCSGGKYGDLYIKQALITNNSTGTIEFTEDTYDLGNNVYSSSPSVSDVWGNNIDGLNALRKLPEGEYKVWLINNNGTFSPSDMLYNVTNSNHLVTEPISIKVIDPANPDISIIHRDNIPYQNDSEVIPTELILDKVVYEQGEPIYFKINGSWVRNRVCILKDDVFYTYNIKDAMESANQTRYAQHGTYYELVQKYKDNPNLTKDYRNFLNTEGLPPGQYKIVYLFGEELEKAWRHTVFGNPHNAAKSRVITIIDITILPNDAVQNHLAYTKTDGTQGTVELTKQSIPQGIKEQVVGEDYKIVQLTQAQAQTIYNTAGYDPKVSANAGTVESLMYRFEDYTVKPAEITYTVTAPADVNTCTCNLTYYYTLLNCGERKRFNLLCPSYSFTKIEN